MAKELDTNNDLTIPATGISLLEKGQEKTLETSSSNIRKQSTDLKNDEDVVIEMSEAGDVAKDGQEDKDAKDGNNGGFGNYIVRICDLNFHFSVEQYSINGGFSNDFLRS
jgi:hypothetical protein